MAETYLSNWSSASRPLKVQCNDGVVYVVKGRQNQRGLVAEYTAAWMGQFIGAPVPQPCLIDIPEPLCQALKQLKPAELGGLQAGQGYGCRFIPDCSDRMGIAHTDKPENRLRFARLAMLYSWFHAGDHQCIYENTQPHRVWSVDHGHFLPGGPNWTTQSLAGQSTVQLDPWFSACTFTPDELRGAAADLNQITDDDIRNVVAASLDSWGIGQAERDALCNFLMQRKKALYETVNKGVNP